MWVKYGRDDKPQEAEGRDTLPFEVFIFTVIALLFYQATDMLEERSKFSGEFGIELNSDGRDGVTYWGH